MPLSFKYNIFANYASQIYVTAIGIVLVPIYVKYMGAEAYGLVGFFAMLQAWFQLLDMGLSPTLSREVARFTAGSSSPNQLRHLLRTLEKIFVSVAILGALSLTWSSSIIASQWLRVEKLPLAEVEHSLKLMAAIVALRWISGLYRGAINGFEQQVWLSGFNILVATARFVLVLPLFVIVGTAPVVFFGYQLIVAGFETVILVLKTYQLLPSAKVIHENEKNEIFLSSLKFSAGIAFTSSIWVLVTQSDKLILSKFLSLSDYAYYTLAVLLASGVMVVSHPITTALLPRMTNLSARQAEDEVIALYRRATRWVAGVTFPIAIVLAVFAEKILIAWSGDALLARTAAPVLSLYALGNAVLALAAFPYYLQFAKGNLRLHMIGNGAFAIFLIPSLIWLTRQYGMIGAGVAWLSSNVLYFLVWIPLVHRRFVPNLHTQWIIRDVGIVIIPIASCALVAKFLMPWSTDRIFVAIEMGILGLMLLAVGIISSGILKYRMMERSIQNLRQIAKR